MLDSELLPLEELVAVLAVCQLLLDLVQLMLQDHWLSTIWIAKHVSGGAEMSVSSAHIVSVLRCGGSNKYVRISLLMAGRRRQVAWGDVHLRRLMMLRHLLEVEVELWWIAHWWESCCVVLKGHYLCCLDLPGRKRLKVEALLLLGISGRSMTRVKLTGVIIMRLIK